MRVRVTLTLILTLTLTPTPHPNQVLGCDCGGCCETPLDASCVDRAWPANLPSLYRSGLGLGLVLVLMLVLM